MTGPNRPLLVSLIILGVIATAYYFSWWFEADRYADPKLLLFLIGMLLYVTPQVFFVWYIYLHARKPEIPAGPPQRTYSVDVYLPTFNEPLELIERTLRAVVGIRYPHTTYVIDDGCNDQVQRIAAVHGATYIRRSDTRDNKAGNINNALKQSSGEIVVVFDIDHIPQPDFLDRVVPYFEDPGIGVVQVALDHYNKEENYIAAATGRMSDEFFAATMNGMDRLGCAVVFGSNAIFRRTALLSLGGYRPGLAEDLNTSVHLHASGWKSAYLPLILAKGLVPADLDAFFKQQSKWARGVFDVLIRVMPKLAGRLNANQCICYATRMTYYLAGPVIGLHIALTILAPFLAISMDSMGEYIQRGVPFVLSYVLVHMAAYDAFALKPGKVQAEIRGMLLVISSWPVYSFAFISAIFKRTPKFVPTPKTHSSKPLIRLIAPQLITIVLLLISLFVHIQTSSPLQWEFVILVSILVIIHLGLLPASFVRHEELERAHALESLGTVDH